MSESTNVSPKYRVAIVGCGGISRAHGNAWRNVPEIEIVGACDEKFESLANFATEYNVQNTYNDLRQMLEKQQPDVLVIATWALKSPQKCPGGSTMWCQRYPRRKTDRC